MPNSLLPFADEKSSRRVFFGRAAHGVGKLALASLLSPALLQTALGATAKPAKADKWAGVVKPFHYPPRARRVIWLTMAGGPSHLDLLDYKPLLNQRHGEQLPDSVRGGQRLTGMSGNQSSIPMVGSPFKFARHGQAGGWFSELLPHTAGIADDLGRRVEAEDQEVLARRAVEAGEDVGWQALQVIVTPEGEQLPITIDALRACPPGYQINITITNNTSA
jgi:hypothetical protein